LGYPYPAGGSPRRDNFFFLKPFSYVRKTLKEEGIRLGKEGEMKGAVRYPVKDCALILLGALLYVLSFPKISWSFLIWVAFVPWFMAFEGKGAWGRFRLGLGAGILSSLGLYYWLTHAMRHYGGLNWLTSIFILLLLVAYLALYFGVFAWLWGFFPPQEGWSVVAVPSLWVALEYGRAHFLTGFPWELAGHSQYNVATILQLSELTGVYGISFLILLVNQTLYRLWMVRDRSGAMGRGKWAVPAMVLLLVIGVIFFGRSALNREEALNRRAKALSVAVVQGNIDQSVKWNPAFQEATVFRYLELSRSAAPSGPEVVIWPETAVPFYFLKEPLYTPKIFELARRMDTYLLFGSPAVEYRPGEGAPRFYNRAYLLGPDGRLSHYDKVHLVPYGEYVPLKKWFPFLGKMVEAVGDFSPGEGVYGLNHPQGKLGVLICFETIFPEISRVLNKDRVGLLVNLTNDAWYGRTSGPYQHLSLLVFRAVENRIWVARAANTGISAVIDSGGRMVKTLPLLQAGVLTATVPIRGERTLYARYGDWWVGLCMLLFAAALVRRFLQRRRGER